MIKCGIIGLGKIGKVRAQEIKRYAGADFVGYYDVSGPDAEVGSKYCTSVDELLAMDIDAMFVCAFNNVAAEYTIKALQAGCHVFCEKPPARHYSELEKVISVESQTGLVLKYGFNHRYHYSVIEAKKMVESGMFGKLLWLRGVYGKAGGNLFSENWRNNREMSGGGILIDQGIHMLDLMTYFAGEFVDVQSLVQTCYWDITVEDNAFALMRTGEGVAAMLHSSATQWRHRFTLDMCFEEGAINLEGILSGTRSYGDETINIVKRQFEDSTFAIGKPREEKIYFDKDDSWQLEVEEFFAAVKREDIVQSGTSDDALRVLRLIDTIYQNSMSKKGVDLDSSSLF